MIPIKEGFLMTPWAILYDETSLALERLYGLVSVQTPVLCLPFAQADQTLLQSHHIIHLGREENCPAPAGGYRIRAEKDENGLLRILLTGDGMINLLYAVVDFENDYLVRARNADCHMPVYYFNSLFTDDMPEFDQSYVPSIRTRGLWTWGYVIHDYRGYLDHMVTLKLNQLIIWNDTPPLNAREIIAYAHARGIQIIWGFAWGWDTNCLAANVQDLSALTRQIIETYERDYAPLGGDGIYFQSFTETSQEEIGGVLIADAVVRLVNQTADQLLSRYPDLKIQFGLHATSVRNRLSYIAQVDPRVDILWEDCGAFPYHYFAKKIDDLEETKAFTRQLQTLRARGFGAVLKGMICLDWNTFTHQPGPFVLGEASPAAIARRTEEKRPFWKYIQAYWLRNADVAMEIIRMYGPDDTIASLVEDGMFEKHIWFPVALYAAMLWDNKADIKDLIAKTALIPQVEFA